MPTTAELAANHPKILAHLKGFLLLQKEHDVTHNALAIMGLFATDFPSEPSLIWDQAGITVQTTPFLNECTCKEFPKDPKVYKLADALHANRCAWAMAHKMLMHPCLLDVEDDGETMTWNFQWPRAIEEFRAVIGTRFQDATNNDLWPAFRKSWQAITDLMPEPEFSLAEKTGTVPVTEEEWIPESEVPADDTFDMDFDAQTNDPEPPTFDSEAGSLLPEPENSISIVHGAGNPAVEAAAQAYFDANAGKVQAALEPVEKRKPGRPKGTGAKDREAAKELAPADFAPTVNKGGKKVFPSCQKFAHFASEELGRLCSVVEMILVAEDSFPVDTIQSLKNSLDRLALRAAHLELRGRHENDEAGALNPMVEVTIANIEAATGSAVRDLALAPDKTASWEVFKKALKEVIDVAGSMDCILSQTGMGPVVSEPPRLSKLNLSRRTNP